MVITPPPPSDRLLSPRFIFPYYSIWAHSGIELQPAVGTHAKYENNECWMWVDNNYSGKPILLNGQPILGKHRLEDGDFLLFPNRSKAVFQQNPLKDFQCERDQLNQLPKEIDVSQRLYENVIINVEGIALNKRMNLTKWDDINNLLIQPSGSGYHITLSCYLSPPEQTSFINQNTGFILSVSEIKCFVIWLLNFVPCHLSIITVFNGHFRFMDGYGAIAFTKIVEPMRRGERHLPYSERFILENVPIRDDRRSAIIGTTILVAAIFFVWMLNGFNSNTFIPLLGIFVLLLGIWGILNAIIRFLDWILRQWRPHLMHEL